MAYTIQSVRKAVDITPDKGFREVYLISYKTDKGSELFLRIPVEEFNVDEVRRRMESESQAVDKLYGI